MTTQNLQIQNFNILPCNPLHSTDRMLTFNFLNASFIKTS